MFQRLMNRPYNRWMIPLRPVYSHRAKERAVQFVFPRVHGTYLVKSDLVPRNEVNDSVKELFWAGRSQEDRVVSEETLKIEGRSVYIESLHVSDCAP